MTFESARLFGSFWKFSSFVFCAEFLRSRLEDWTLFFSTRMLLFDADAYLKLSEACSVEKDDCENDEDGNFQERKEALRDGKSVGRYSEKKFETRGFERMRTRKNKHSATTMRILWR